MKFCKNCKEALVGPDSDHTHYCSDCLRMLITTAFFTACITQIVNGLGYLLINLWVWRGLPQ